MLSKSPSRPKSETVIGGGLCPDTWATAFNDSYVGTCRSCAFGQEQTISPGNCVAPSGCQESFTAAGSGDGRCEYRSFGR